MFEQVPEHVREHVHDILDRLLKLEQRWPEKGLLSFHEPPSVYTYHPFLFWESFPSVSVEAMRDLSLAAMLASSAACLRDRIMDRPGPAPPALRCGSMPWSTSRISSGIGTSPRARRSGPSTESWHRRLRG